MNNGNFLAHNTWILISLLSDPFPVETFTKNNHEKLCLMEIWKTCRLPRKSLNLGTVLLPKRTASPIALSSNLVGFPSGVDKDNLSEEDINAFNQSHGSDRSKEVRKSASNANIKTVVDFEHHVLDDVMEAEESDDETGSVSSYLKSNLTVAKKELISGQPFTHIKGLSRSWFTIKSVNGPHHVRDRFLAFGFRNWVLF